MVSSWFFDGANRIWPLFEPALKKAYALEAASSKASVRLLAMRTATQTFNWIGALHEVTKAGQAIFLPKHYRFVMPVFEIKKTGPDHLPTFAAKVSIAGDVLAEAETGQVGSFTSVKEAKSAAARIALEHLQEKYSIQIGP